MLMRSLTSLQASKLPPDASAGLIPQEQDEGSPGFPDIPGFIDFQFDVSESSPPRLPRFRFPTKKSRGRSRSPEPADEDEVHRKLIYVSPKKLGPPGSIRTLVPVESVMRVAPLNRRRLRSIEVDPSCFLPDSRLFDCSDSSWLPRRLVEEKKWQPASPKKPDQKGPADISELFAGAFVQTTLTARSQPYWQSGVRWHPDASGEQDGLFSGRRVRQQRESHDSNLVDPESIRSLASLQASKEMPDASAGLIPEEQDEQ